MGSSRRIEKCPQSGWGCMGGGATDHHLEDHLNPVQLYSIYLSISNKQTTKIKDENIPGYSIIQYMPWSWCEHARIIQLDRV